MSNALLIVGILIGAIVIALAVAQGQSITYVTNQTVVNPYGITVPAGNITNVTNFQDVNYTYPGNTTFIGKLCLNSNCSSYIQKNSTGVLISGG